MEIEIKSSSENIFFRNNKNNLNMTKNPLYLQRKFENPIKLVKNAFDGEETK